MTAVEEWRPVPGYEGYEVSSLGRLISHQQRKPRLMKLRAASNRYLSVDLRRQGQRTTCTVHRLVAEAFHGPSPEGKPEVRHLDGDHLNNSRDNLQWGSRSENIRDAVSHGTHYTASKTHCPRNHPYNEANTYRTPSARECLVCKRARGRAYAARVRARWFAEGAR